MMVMLKEMFDFDRVNWNEKAKPKVANVRKLSEEHKRKIGQANKARKREKEKKTQENT